MRSKTRTLKFAAVVELTNLAKPNLALSARKNMHPHTKLREQYAKERTMLSIDRTILSYIRTSLTTFAMGITFIKFFDDDLLVIGGFILVAFSIILLLFGIRRGLQAHKHIKKYVISQSSE